ncbi:MAG: LytR C-terminal domain-containing protein [Solirubrobacterales bacterium]
MGVGEIFDTVGGFIAAGAVLGLILLLPLYLSQRRDVKRLRALREADPDYAAENLSTSERRLDSAETELEEITGATAVAPPEPGGTPAGGIPAATRVTHERPALERITMERAALAPHPRWRHFVDRATQPRVLVAIGAAALLLGAAAIFVSQALLSDDELPQQRVGRIVPGEVDVAIFNGTSINGLAGKVASDIEAAGYKVVAITNTEPGFANTEVLYEDRQKPAAQKGAGDLGVRKVEPLDRDLRRQAENADVVVIAGEDRA